MPDSLSIGIVVPSNTKGGPQKVAALAARDLAQKGHQVTIFIPVLPYYYYFMSLKAQPILWLKTIRPYIKDWARNRRFCFQELLSIADGPGRVSVRFVARRAGRRALANLECLVLNTIAQVAEYQHRFPQERQIYLLHHPEEHVHMYAEQFQELRRTFAGKTVVISPFTAREVSGQILDPPVVLNPISPTVWEWSGSIDPRHPRRDILLFWKDSQCGPKGGEIVRKLLSLRPETSVTIWCRGGGHREAARRLLPGVDTVENLSELELCDLYSTHSLLMFPSTYEGFGMPPIEALACGCIPILRPDVGVAELYAKDGENSIYLNGDAEGVARRIADLLEHPEDLDAMRANARDAIAPFDPNGYGQRLLEAGGFLSGP